MNQIIFCLLWLGLTVSTTQAQTLIQTSTNNHLKPYKFETIQNEAVFFQMVISSNDIEEEEMEHADFLVFSNATNNALIIQSANRSDWFDLTLTNKTATTKIQKTDLQEITMLDLSTLSRGTYQLNITAKEKNYTYTIVLR